MKSSLLVTHDKEYIFILSKYSMAKILIQDALDSNLKRLLEKLEDDLKWTAQYVQSQ